MKAIPTIILASASMALQAHAQEFREIPVQPDPVEEPLTMEQLLKEEIEKAAGGPATRDEEGHPRLNEAEQELRRMHQQIRGKMMLQEAGKPSGIENPDGPRWLIGVAVEPVHPFVREHLGIEEGTGVRVTLVEPRLPAGKAGIVVNDLILAADGQKVTDLDGLKEIVAKCGKEGRSVPFEIVHRGERKTITLEPEGSRPEKLDRKEKREAPGPERRFAEMARRLDRQEKQISQLNKEVRKLRKQLEQDQERENRDEDE